jgi:hypothetical protein
MESTKDLSEKDLIDKIGVLQERLVCFHAILCDIECPEAKSVLEMQINNYVTAIQHFHSELQLRERVDPANNSILDI